MAGCQWNQPTFGMTFTGAGRRRLLEVGGSGAEALAAGADFERVQGRDVHAVVVFQLPDGLQ